MDVKKFMKFNNEKRVQMLGSVQTKYQMHISSAIETPRTPTFPLLTPSAANFINEKSSDFHSASGRGNTRTQPVKGCRNQKKKKKIISYIEYKKTDPALYKLLSNMNTRIIIYILIGG